MKANKQSKIRVPKSGFNRARFNWSHDVNTTFSWGEVQPTQVKMLQPNSKTTMSTQELVRLAPMVAPTFGRVKLKTFNQFVGMSDIFANYPALMAQEPVNRIGGTKVPQALPSCRLGQLSLWVLLGARCTVYWKSTAWSGDDLVNGVYRTEYRKLSSDLSTLELSSEAQAVRSAITSSGVFAVDSRNYQNLSILGTKLYFQPKALTGTSGWNAVFGDSNSNGDYMIPLSLESYDQLFPVDRQYSRVNSPYATIAALDKDVDYEVTPEGADYLVEGEVLYNNTTFRIALAFECSDIGKRIRKVLQGCGYQINFASDKFVSILPLIAQYKAYFDVFGLQLYKNWESSYCAKLINRIDQFFVSQLGHALVYGTSATEYINVLPEATASVNNDARTLFTDFMLLEVTREWYTEEPDFIGAHIDKLAVSPEVDKSGFLSVTSSALSESGIGAPNIGSYNTANPDGVSVPSMYPLDRNRIDSVITATHDFINNAQHGQVDAELLKRIYKWTNRNSVLGRAIAALLRAQGLGDYVEECKSNYIGSSDDLITISDVVSMAATQDATLGEYGGRGLQYSEHKTLVFENDELGYWITLSTIVPQAGYTQGIDPTLFALDKFSLYNPDFDAIGMEMTTKDVIVGNSYICRLPAAEANSGTMGFGFIPRYSKFKIAQNLVNGDFNRHNKRSVYLPYTLDKQITCNDYEQDYENYQQSAFSGFSRNSVEIGRSSETKELPVANPVWRTPTEHSWMGNFDRIFYNIGSRDGQNRNVHPNSLFSYYTGFSDFNDDNFLSHAIVDMMTYAPMKPIEESYGLDDMEDPTGKAGSDYVTKAS